MPALPPDALENSYDDVLADHECLNCGSKCNCNSELFCEHDCPEELDDTIGDPEQ